MTRKILSMKGSKVVPFEQNGEFYYRKAQKYIDNNNYFNALGCYRKAAEKEPDNFDYLLDLAEIFTEMNCYEDSNQVLLYLIQDDEVSSSECYFGIGCNFLGLQDYDKAQECFMKYLKLDPKGEFSEEAQDLLDILETQDIYQDDLGICYDQKKIQLYKMANKGKEYLDQGNYKKAIAQLEKVLKDDPSLTFVTNNLALAYFCQNQIDKAIILSESILNDDPQNVHANCNLVLFYNEIGVKDKSEFYLKIIMEFHTEEPEELYKISVTLCEMKCHMEAQKRLKNLLLYKPYDKKILHYLAVAFFNTMHYKEALGYWDKIDKIDPGNTIAIYYKHYVVQCMKGEIQDLNLVYHYQVPYEEIVKRIKRINNIIKSPIEDIKSRWNKNEHLKILLLWGLELNDVIIKRNIIMLIASLKDYKAEKILRQFLLRKNETDALKKEILTLLKQIGAKEPYVAYMKNSIVEVRVNILAINGGKVPAEYQKILGLVLRKMRRRYSVDYIKDIVSIWDNYIQRIAPSFPQIYKQEAWAAALELCFCIKNDIHIHKAQICSFYKISVITLNHHYRSIINTVNEGENNGID